MALDLNKYSKESDSIVDLYRAALYLARGNRKTGLDFLNKAKAVFGDKMKFNEKVSDKVLAEKILDFYKKQRLSSQGLALRG